MKKKAFTLIELLVVISIIALLVSILMPALSKARMIAKRSVCAAHLRGCIQAGNMYSQDNQGKFGQQHAPSGTGSYAIYVTNQARTSQRYLGHGLYVSEGYMDDPELYYCPANNNKTLQYGIQSPDINGGGWPRSGQLPEALPAGQVWVQSTYHFRSLWDGQKWRSVNPDKDGGSMGVLIDVFADNTRGVEFHHKVGYNAAFSDSHVNFISDKFDKPDGTPGGTVENLAKLGEINSKLRYHTDHAMQDYVWKKHVEGTFKYPLPWGTR